MTDVFQSASGKEEKKSKKLKQTRSNGKEDTMKVNTNKGIKYDTGVDM